MRIDNFFAELKRRNVYKVAVAYVVVAWLLIQVATQVFPFFNIPNWIVRLVVLFAIIGFLIAVVCSWAFEITPEGIKLEEDVDRRIKRKTGRKLTVLIVIVAAMAAGVTLFRFQHLPQTTEAAKQPLPAVAIESKSIAVLPFENLSDDKQNAYFAEGIQDEILTQLGNIAELKVISRTSTQRFKDSTDDVRTIAHQLGVANILEGRVQKSYEQVRVNVQLIDAKKGVHLWAETYDRTLNDIFAVEAEIARNVAKILKAKLTGAAERSLAARPTENPGAHELYLQGSYYNDHGTEADYRKAIDCYQGAIRLDQNYALAHTGLASSLNNLARKFLSGAEAQKAYADARAAGDAALALDPDLAVAHTARAFSFESDFKWTEAEAEYRRALQLSPNDDAVKTALASLLATRGRPDEAIELARQELANDPLCASCYHWLSTYLCSLGQLDEAEKAMRRAIDLQPGHADFYTQLTVIAVLRGDAKAALSAAQKEIAAGGWQEIALALAQQISGDPVAAAAALKALIDHQPDDAAYQIAQIYALRKEPDRVFEWLERAWSNRDPGIGELLYDPFLLRYKTDPRFATFCHEVRLPPPAASSKS